MLLVDTSALLAGYDGSDEHHEACLRFFNRDERRLLSPFALAELDYLLLKARGGAGERVMLNDVARGVFELASFDSHDVGDAMRVVEHYHDLGIGLADASIVVLAERYKCLDLLTLDQRHFRAISGPGGRPFRIRPFDD